MPPAPPAPARAAAWSGYALAGLATLLWVGCSLPSGVPQGGSLLDDAGTPLYREPWVLVPALVLLVVGPAAVALTPGRLGRLMILAATDTFVTLFAALVLTAAPGGWAAFTIGSGGGLALLLALYVLGTLSALEARRLVLGRTGPPGFGLGGARLALCLLVLALPSQMLLVAGQERALLLAPFLLVAVSAGGARVSRSREGLGLTAALLHLGLAAEVLVTLRYTVLRAAPRITDVRLPGRLTLDLAWGLVALAGVQALAHLVPLLRSLRRAPAATSAAPGGGT